jgi:myosin-5
LWRGFEFRVRPCPCRVNPQALFKQLFRFINVQLFNQLLLRRECCSFSNGEYLKTGLEQVAHWINGAGADYIADFWEELKYLRQVRAQRVKMGGRMLG